MRRILVTILFLVATTATAEQPYMPTDAERARWTLNDMMTLKTAIEAYRIDHKAAPDAKSVDELRAAVEPMYVAKLPTTDAWGHAYAYERVGDDYRIVSAGSDGAFDRTSWSTGGKQTDLSHRRGAQRHGALVVPLLDVPVATTRDASSLSRRPDNEVHRAANEAGRVAELSR